MAEVEEPGSKEPSRREASSMAEVEEPFSRCFEDLASLNTFLDVCLSGFERAREATGWLQVNREIAEAMKRPDPFPSDESLEDAKKNAERLEAFAKREAATGHPYLYGIGVVRLWTILETMADDVALLQLKESRYNAAAEILAKLRVPVLEFVGATPNEQAELVLEELKRATRAALQDGIARFEAILSAVGLGGGIEDEVRKAIFECRQVRNLIVHRSGNVDARFLRACPWFRTRPEEPLPLQRNHFSYYLNASYAYSVEILRRRRVATTGETLPQSLVNAREKLLERVRGTEATRPKGL